MSTYFVLYESLQSTQYQVVTILLAIGLVWGVCWVWVDHRSRHKTPTKWAVIVAALLAMMYTVTGGAL